MLQLDLGPMARTIRSRLSQRCAGLERLFQDYVESGGLLEDTARLAREIITERTTSRNVDLDGRPFTPYSEKYNEWKTRCFGRGNPPDLSLSGRMLADIVLHREGPLSGRLAFATPRSGDIAFHHQQGRHPMPRRAFFGIRPSSPDAARLTDAVIRSFNQRLRNYGANGVRS
jgi:hypothetical protein